MSDKLLEEIERRLKAKTIHDLRQVARAVGIPRPADGRKERILDCIMSIASGNSDPVAPAVRGAHPKSAEYDRQLVADIFKCRELSLSAIGKENGQDEENEPQLIVSSGENTDLYEFNAQGILEKNDGKWFIRINGCRENFISDIYVNDFFIKNFGLREGDLISGKCKRASLDEMAGLASLNTVNGAAPNSLPRISFEQFTPVYPDKQLKIARGASDTAGRIIDLLSPVGAGQRAIICAPHGCGKTVVLKDIAAGLQQNNPDVKLIILLIDARPEEAADFSYSFPNSDVFTSPFDEGVGSHVRTARLALEYAKRQAENGNVALILDDLTRLTRAYNSCGKVSTALSSDAVDSVKKFLAAAKNTREGKSLTIISALSCEGDDIDAAIYSGLKDVCNMRITLSKQLARTRVYPPIDISATHTLGDEKLLSSDEIKAADRLRGQSIQSIIELIEKTNSNVQLIQELTD